MSNRLDVSCRTCGSGRTMESPPWPAKVLHTCDPVEPDRAYWALIPEDMDPGTTSRPR